jgi:hypothetical protein
MLLGFAIALVVIVIVMTIVSLKAQKIDRQLAEIDWLFSADDQAADG